MFFVMLSAILVALLMVEGVATIRPASSSFTLGGEAQAAPITTSTIGVHGLEATASFNSSSHRRLRNAKLPAPRLLLTSARATFYTDYSETSCYGSSHKELGLHYHFAALRTGLFHSNRCGQCILVTCVGGTQGDGNPCHSQHNQVYVKVADECVGECYGALDLSFQAFNYIAKPDEGIIKITYSFVSKTFCDS